MNWFKISFNGFIVGSVCQARGVKVNLNKMLGVSKPLAQHYGGVSTLWDKYAGLRIPLERFLAASLIGQNNSYLCSAKPLQHFSL